MRVCTEKARFSHNISLPGDILEGRINEVLQRFLQVPDSQIELHVLKCKSCVPVVQQVVALGPELLYYFEKEICEVGHALQSVVREGAELLDGRKNIDQLEQAPAKIIEFAENFFLVEVKLSALRLEQQPLFGETVLFVERLCGCVCAWVRDTAC